MAPPVGSCCKGAEAISIIIGEAGLRGSVFSRGGIGNGILVANVHRVVEYQCVWHEYQCVSINVSGTFGDIKVPGTLGRCQQSCPVKLS